MTNEIKIKQHLACLASGWPTGCLFSLPKPNGESSGSKISARSSSAETKHLIESPGILFWLVEWRVHLRWKVARITCASVCVSDG